MNRRTLILVSGPPGAGKSTLSKAIAKEFRCVLLDKDCVDEPFSPNDRGTLYKKEIEPKVLQALLNLVKLNFEVHDRILIDLPWTHVLLHHPHWKLALEDFVAAVKAKLLVLELTLSETTLYQRIQKRGLRRDAVKLSQEGWERFKGFNRIFETIPLPHFLINAEESKEVCFQKSCQYLGKEL